MKIVAILIGAALLATAASSPALAKSAKCFTTDDGYYDCDFKAMGSDGSFEITAEDYPSFQIEIDSPGKAFGYGQFTPDGNFTPLPGEYTRASDDPACWENSDTNTKICAW